MSHRPGTPAATSSTWVQHSDAPCDVEGDRCSGPLAVGGSGFPHETPAWDEGSSEPTSPSDSCRPARRSSNYPSGQVRIVLQLRRSLLGLVLGPRESTRSSRSTRSSPDARRGPRRCSTGSSCLSARSPTRRSRRSGRGGEASRRASLVPHEIWRTTEQRIRKSEVVREGRVELPRPFGHRILRLLQPGMDLGSTCRPVSSGVVLCHPVSFRREQDVSKRGATGSAPTVHARPQHDRDHAPEVLTLP